MANLGAALHHHLALKQALRQAFPDLAEDDPGFADSLEGESNLNETITLVVRSAHEDKTLADALKARIADMRERLARLEGRAEKKRDVVADAMVSANLKTIQAPEFTITAARGRAAVIVFDEAQIPDDYMVQPPAPPPKPDKTLIIQALKDGYHVPGCNLSNPRPHLTVRSK